MTGDQARTELDYVKRMLEGAMLYIDTNHVPVCNRARNNIQNAIHSIVAQLREEVQQT